MNIVSAQALSKTHGIKPLFQKITFGMEDRDRVGLIGINGCGKSTLLKIIAGVETADEGKVTFRQDLRVEYLPQNPEFPPDSNVLECLFAGTGETPEIVREYEATCAKLEHNPQDPTLLRRLEAVSHRMDSANAWEYEFQARTILGKLGVTDLEAQVHTLSGGYRKRIALAHALLADADLLILDEPTNHLDADTIAWLEGYLERFRGAVLLVTHDRYFLDRVTDRIVELDAGQLRYFEGNFSYYLERKAEIAAAEVAEDQRRRSILRKELAWLQRGARARRTKEKHRIDRIAAMREAPALRVREGLSFEIDVPRLGGKIVEFENVSKSYGGRNVVSDFTYTMRPGERLGIIGPNGSGKTTLANMLVGRIAPDRGQVSVGQTVSFGYFDQESTEFDPTERALDYVKREGGDMLRGTDGTTLGAALVMERFYFTPQMLYTPVSKLSGGEQRRLYLIRTLMRNPNFLLLDEPANDLDIPTLQALEDFLDTFPGCLVVISHDRYFLDRTVDHLLSFEQGGKLRLYPGNYSVYEEMRETDDNSSGEGEQRNLKSAPIEKADKVTLVQPDKPKAGKLTFGEKRELAQLESDIPEIEKRLKDIESELLAAASDFQRLQELTSEQQTLAARLEQNVERWSVLAERA